MQKSAILDPALEPKSSVIARVLSKVLPVLSISCCKTPSACLSDIPFLAAFFCSAPSAVRTVDESRPVLDRLPRKAAASAESMPSCLSAVEFLTISDDRSLTDVPVSCDTLVKVSRKSPA